MNSQQTDNSQQNQQSIQDWMPEPMDGKAKSTKQANEQTEAKFREFLKESTVNEISPIPNATIQNVIGMVTDDTIQSKESNSTADSLQTESTELTELTQSIGYISTKRTSQKQRKESLEEYRETFLQVPKIEDRKPVFISCELRDKLDEITRRLGGRKMSVSGLIENLVRHHLEIYKEDFEIWKKL